MVAVAAFLTILATGSTSPFPACDSILVRLDPPDTTPEVFLPGIVSGPAEEYGLTEPPRFYRRLCYVRYLRRDLPLDLRNKRVTSIPCLVLILPLKTGASIPMKTP
jgi:hypothetical protein